MISKDVQLADIVRGLARYRGARLEAELAEDNDA